MDRGNQAAEHHRVQTDPYHRYSGWREFWHASPPLAVPFRYDSWRKAIMGSTSMACRLGMQQARGGARDGMVAAATKVEGSVGHAP
jgi:hypothetical protein